MIESKAERQPVAPVDTSEQAEQRRSASMTPAELLVHLAEVVRVRAQDPEFQQQHLASLTTDDEVMGYAGRKIAQVALTLEVIAEQKHALAFSMRNIDDTIDYAQATQELVELQQSMMRMGIKPVGMGWAYWGLSNNSGKLLNFLLAEARGEKSETDYTKVSDLDVVAAIKELRESGALQDGDPPRLKFDFNL